MSRPTLESRRCRAHSSQTGEPCKRWASHGATVCTSHGAAAPQVERAATARIQAMVPFALDRLLALVDGADTDGVKLAAVRDILDRAGYKPPERVHHGADADQPLRVEVVYVDDDPAAGPGA